MSRALILIVFGAAVALSIGWISWGKQQKPDQGIAVVDRTGGLSPIENASNESSNDQSAPNATIEIPAVQATAPVDTPASQLPEWDMRLDKAVEILVPMAEAGNIAAQIDLSRRLGSCTAYSMRKMEESDERSRDSLKELQESPTMTEPGRGYPIANQTVQLESNAATRADCAEVSPELIANWLLPLERAANAGDTGAMRKYAEVSVQEYESLGAVFADSETALHRRDKARAYLFEAIRRGDANALTDVAFCYAERSVFKVPLFSPDPYKFYVYAYARLLSTAAFEMPLHERTLRWLSSEAAATFDAETLARAEAEGRKIFAACCSSS